MNVLVVEPMKKPYIKDINSGLSSLQHEVGGYIEATYPYEDLVGLICNEEGKLDGLPLNRAIYNENGEMVDIIAGTFLIVGLSEDNFAGCPTRWPINMQSFLNRLRYFTRQTVRFTRRRWSRRLNRRRKKRYVRIYRSPWILRHSGSFQYINLNARMSCMISGLSLTIISIKTASRVTFAITIWYIPAICVRMNR